MIADASESTHLEQPAVAVARIRDDRVGNHQAAPRRHRVVRRLTVRHRHIAQIDLCLRTAVNRAAVAFGAGYAIARERRIRDDQPAAGENGAAGGRRSAA
jgi:hypothetical protein